MTKEEIIQAVSILKGWDAQSLTIEAHYYTHAYFGVVAGAYDIAKDVNVIYYAQTFVTGKANGNAVDIKLNDTVVERAYTTSTPIIYKDLIFDSTYINAGVTVGNYYFLGFKITNNG